MADQHNTSAAGHGTYKSYITGFLIAVVLTVIPFWVVMDGTLSPELTLVTIFTLAIIQLAVHIYFFLHLDTSKEQRMNLAIFLYTGIVVAIILAGNGWIMHNTHVLMMLNH